MARVIEFAARAVWYVPDIDGNREDPDPFAVLVEPLSGAEMAQLEMASSDFAGDSIIGRVHAVEELIATRRIKDVRGYSVLDADSGKVVTPKTGAELVAAIKMASAAERNVLREIVNAVQSYSQLKEGLLGKSISPLDSGSQAINAPGIGAAASASASLTATNSEQSETATATQTKTLDGVGRQDCGAALGPS
jgi:hypothetical protein